MMSAAHEEVRVSKALSMPGVRSFDDETSSSEAASPSASTVKVEGSGEL